VRQCIGQHPAWCHFNVFTLLVTSHLAIYIHPATVFWHFFEQLLVFQKLLFWPYCCFVFVLCMIRLVCLWLPGFILFKPASWWPFVAVAASR